MNYATIDKVIGYTIALILLAGGTLAILVAYGII